jgi:putative acetyltransferase
MALHIRRAKKGDEPGVVDVIKGVYDEYGFTWEADGYHADLYDIETHYAEPDAFWVAFDSDTEERMVGTVAVEFFDALPGEPGAETSDGDLTRIAGCDCSLERLYVRADTRGLGVGKALNQVAIDFARENGATAMELWSDKRFTQAHNLYLRLGASIITERILHTDPDKSVEYGLFLPLN